MLTWATNSRTWIALNWVNQSCLKRVLRKHAGESVWKIEFIYFSSLFFFPFAFIFPPPSTEAPFLTQSLNQTSKSNKVESISPLEIPFPRPIVVCELSPCLWNDFSSSSLLSFLFYVSSSTSPPQPDPISMSKYLFLSPHSFFSSPFPSPPPLRRTVALSRRKASVL